MKFKKCSHMKPPKFVNSAVRIVSDWFDSAGIHWIEEQCSECGRVWRSRSVK